MPNTPLKPAALRSAGYILILFDDDIPDIHKAFNADYMRNFGKTVIDWDK